ncbi:hypothetical protein A1O1_08515 [Capronia coronata CBS 617.96]|uniref:Uncharacterized protein n=1 Tax=Capronia coronata CBS 617.96 TaxID=1182541 RepID=W9XTS8_9EURO|nr:uncharacterized protein A1O1_08515 [Capronia coronata CBS 617.96]EXJ80371.1 hypothetical protein A1O1_08515 [Capronia coronata CBS 617.96]
MSAQAMTLRSGARYADLPKPLGTIKFKEPVDDDDDDDDGTAAGRTRKRKREAKAAKDKERQLRADARAERRYGKAPAAPKLTDDKVNMFAYFQEADEGPSSKKRAKTSAKGADKGADNKQDEESKNFTSLVLKDGSGKTTLINLDFTLANFLAHRSPELLAHMEAAKSLQTSSDMQMVSYIACDPNMVNKAPKLKAPKLKAPKIKAPVRAGPTLLGLPSELRVPIYRLLFLRGGPIDFTERTNFCRSSGLLSTCKEILKEGRKVLYGENAFHFARNLELRGKYWEAIWKEIAYHDVRRFLETIGPVNVSHLKHVSFILTDGALGKTNRYIPIDERRFVNDANLHQIFRIIGANATLHKLAIQVAGRCKLANSDHHFLKAISEVKCHELIFINKYRHEIAKLPDKIKAQLEAALVIPFDTTDVIHPAYNDRNKVPMYWEGMPGLHHPITFM